MYDEYDNDGHLTASRHYHNEIDKNVDELGTGGRWYEAPAKSVFSVRVICVLGDGQRVAFATNGFHLRVKTII